MSRADLLLERVHLGEATAEEEAELRGDPELVQRLEALDQTNSVFHATFPAEEQVAAIQRKVHVANTRDAVRKRNRALGGLGLLVPLVAAAAVMFAAPELVVGERENPMENRTKGDASPGLSVDLKGDDGKPVPLTPGAVAKSGDVLQLSYQSAGASHGVVVSIDGGGTVSLHHPESVQGSTALGKGTVELPHGYALDDAPRFERFFFVTDDEAIDVRAVLAVAETLGGTSDASTAPLSLPEGLEQNTFLVRKAER